MGVRGFMENDEISLNKNYQPRAGIRIDFVEFNPELTQDDKDEANRKIEEERWHSIDACIYRNLRHDGPLKKQQLVASVIQRHNDLFPCPASLVEMRLYTCAC